MKKFVLILAMFVLTATSMNIEAGNDVAWQHEYPREINWMMISDVGILLLGTDDALYGVDPETGEEMWKREDQKKIDKEYIETIPQTPIILVTRKGLRSELVAINTLNGDKIFSTKDYGMQATNGAMPVYQNATILISGGIDGKNYFMNVGMKDGKVNWKKEDWLGKRILPQLVKLNPDKTFSKAGINGNQNLVFDTDDTFIAHFHQDHLAKYDVNTGEVIWQANFKDYKIRPKPGSASAIALGFSQMMINEERGVLYIPMSNSLVAVDIETGAFVWPEKPEDLKGKISDMEFTKDGILVKTSGEKPYITMLSYETGEELWKKPFKKFKDQGVMIHHEGKIYLLTSDDLFWIDQKTGDYKHLAKNVKFKSEDPQMMSIIGNNIVLTSQQNIMAIDKNSGKQVYHLYLKAPGLSAFEVVGRIAVTAAMNVGSYAMARQRAMAGGANYNPITNTFEYEQYSANLGQRFKKSLETNNYHYISTKEAEVDGNKDIGIVCVNKENGDIESQVLLGDRDPEYEIDEISKLLFFKSKNKEVTCFEL